VNEGRHDAAPAHSSPRILHVSSGRTPNYALVKRRRPVDQAVVDAVERAHKRFASDLHDGVCQELAGIAMILDAIGGRVAAEAAVEIKSVSDRIRRVTLEVRRLALGLAPLAVEREGLKGALALLKMDIQTPTSPTVTVDVDERAVCALSLESAVNLYRIAQEATTNALRHSGCSRIDISVEETTTGLLLVVQDDGCGIQHDATKKCGLGIKTMATRAELLGGELDVLPNEPRGTRVKVTLPIVPSIRLFTLLTKRRSPPA
jgi:signal transduction histidine kinase